MASCYFRKGDYKNAVQYYEKAIEIQVENMSSRHATILSNYFLMGDCYCRMDKMELANEFYERAQGSNDSEAENEENTEQDVNDVLRMHTNLAEAYARQKDFPTASTHEQSMIDQLRENLPAFIVELIEEEDAESMPFDDLHKILKSRLGLRKGTAFAQVLQNFVIIRLSLARALLKTNGQTDNEEDATDIYETSHRTSAETDSVRDREHREPSQQVRRTEQCLRSAIYQHEAYISGVLDEGTGRNNSIRLSTHTGIPSR